MDVLEFVKSCFDEEVVGVKEIGGRKAGREEEVRRVVQASYAERRGGVVRSGLIIVALCRVVLIGVF